MLLYAAGKKPLEIAFQFYCNKHRSRKIVIIVFLNPCNIWYGVNAVYFLCQADLKLSIWIDKSGYKSPEKSVL